MASEAAEAEILIVCSDGDVILNTDTEKTYNIYQGSSSFLHEDVIKDTTLSGLLSENSTCVILPMEQSAYLNGYLVLAQPDQFINNRAIYYTNILTTFFYLIMVIVGFVFLLIYVFNVRPLRKVPASSRLTTKIRRFSLNLKTNTANWQKHWMLSEQNSVNLMSTSENLFPTFRTISAPL